MQQKNKVKTIFHIVTIIMTILIILFILYGLKLGIFKEKEILVSYIQKFGVIAPIFFLFLQMVQVVFPVIPGGASCLAGVLAFGPILGFIYNYIGLVLGSIAAFLLSRRYGLPFVKKLFKEETIEKYLAYIKTKRFHQIFFLGILLPGLPDDLLCYVAGLSNMSLKNFFLYIVVGKPFTLIFYSIFMELF